MEGNHSDDFGDLTQKVLVRIEEVRRRAAPPSNVGYPLSKLGHALEFENVVSIVGDRGAGKTTLLVSVLDQLRSRGDIVLPLVRPEKIEAFNSFAGFILSALNYRLQEWQKDVNDNKIDIAADEAEKLKGISLRLRKVGSESAQTTPAFASNLTNSGATEDEFAVQFRRSTDASVGFGEDWPDVVHRILSWRDRNLKSHVSLRPDQMATSLLVVACDDCDLSPALIPRIIADIARLHSPRVAIVFAYSPEGLTRALAAKMLAEMGPAFANLKSVLAGGEESLIKEISDFERKISPEALRVRVPNLEDARAKLTYRPLGNDGPPLHDLLGATALPQGSSIPTLRSLFDLSEFLPLEPTPVPTQIADILPNSRRGLFNLHRLLALSSLSRQGLDPSSAMPASTPDQDTLVAVLKSIGNAVKGRIPASLAAELDRRAEWLPNNSLRIDNSELDVARSAQRPSILFRGDVAGVFIQIDFQTVIYQTAYFENRDRDTSASIHGKTIFSWMCYANEVASGPFAGGQLESFSKPSLEQNTSIVVRFDHDRSEIPFVMQPRNGSYIPYFIYGYIWRKWGSQIQRLNRNAISRDSLEQSELCTLAHLWLICKYSINEKIEVPDLVSESGKILSVAEMFEMLKFDFSRAMNNLQDRHFFRSWAYPIDFDFIYCFLGVFSSFLFSDQIKSVYKQHILSKLTHISNNDRRSMKQALHEFCLSRINNIEKPHYGNIVLEDILDAVGAVDSSIAREIEADIRQSYAERMEVMNSVGDVLRRLRQSEIITDADMARVSRGQLDPVVLSKIRSVPYGEEIIEILRRNQQTRVNKGQL